jgi:patatin-like phospholipase/acyl hydrolase
MEKKPFKILSIDGGGIKGLYSATVLSRLEEKGWKTIG